MTFPILVSCKNRAMSASCPQQKFHSSWRFPSLFLSSLGSFTILFLWSKLGECIALWFALTPTQVIDGTEKPIRSFANTQRDTMNLAIILYKGNRKLFSRIRIAYYKHLRGWENSQQSWKPSTFVLENIFYCLNTCWSKL